MKYVRAILAPWKGKHMNGVKSLHAALGLAIILSLTSSIAAELGDELFRFTAQDGSNQDFFGTSVDVSGGIAICGAPQNDDTGAAYLFDVATGSQIAKLWGGHSPESNVELGCSVAIDGSIAIVGAKYENSRTGAAYLFDTATSNQIAKLVAADGRDYDYFGSSVDISGSTAICGAFFDDDAGTDSGSAYLFDTQTGAQLQKLVASDAAAGDRFGSSVAISGRIAICGAYADDDAGSTSGSAYLFDTETGDQLNKLTSLDLAEGDQFGYSVAISGTTAVVGAPRNVEEGLQGGAAYLFDTRTGTQIAKLTAPDAAYWDIFGTSVAIDGDIVIVGAPYTDHAGTSSGMAYLFDSSTGEFLASLAASDANADNVFGVSVGTDGDTAVVGSARWDNTRGAAYLYEVPEPTSLSLMAVAGAALLRRKRKL
jgi:WD40 repeat protein